MSFTYDARTAWDRVQQRPARGARGQVFAYEDGAHVSPLAITTPEGVPYANNELYAGVWGVWPDFSQATEFRVRLWDGVFEWVLMSVEGHEGTSAFEVAVGNGFVGTLGQWLASLEGQQGETGSDGPEGPVGPEGGVVVSETEPTVFPSYDPDAQTAANIQDAASATAVALNATYATARVDTTVGKRVFVTDAAGVEHLVSADTGWRDISTLLTTGLAKSSSYGECSVRRENNTVSVALRLDVSGSGSTTVTSPLPIGFNAKQILSTPGIMYIATTAGKSIATTITDWYLSSTSGIRILSALPNPGTVHLTTSWKTSEPWPSSLPGSPA